MTQRSDRSLRLLYGEDVYQRIITSNVLIGGAGGVGCEIIKSLSKCGFRNFTLIDLDTIEITNLNRQFYFRRRHVGLAKSHCAKEGVMEFEPEILNIEAILGNIYDPRFDYQFYKKFDIGFCAFDNQGARRHFGKKCTQADVPVVEAGTSGFNGNVQTRFKGVSICRNCTPETPVVQYNVCSIRTRPQEPIHCIVWAQNMFNLIFGPSDDSNALDNYIADVFPNGIQNVTDIDETGRLLYERIFNVDIQKCDEKVRFPLSLEAGMAMHNTKDAVTVDPHSKRVLLEDERILTVSENTAKFLSSFSQLMTERQHQLGQLKFDKDDALAGKFIAAIANLRTYNFQDVANPKNKLAYISQHKIKEMAGNIIPAIASSNAIVSAIQVSEAIKIMKGLDKTKPELFRDYLVSNGFDSKISIANAQKPNIDCNVCSNANAFIRLKANFATTLLSNFKEFMEKYFQIGEKIFAIVDREVIYDPFITSFKDAYKQYLKRTLITVVESQKDKNTASSSMVGEQSQVKSLSIRIYDTSSPLNWEVFIENDENATQIQCDAKTTPDKINAGHLQYIRASKERINNEKLRLFQQYDYVKETAQPNSPVYMEVEDYN